MAEFSKVKDAPGPRRSMQVRITAETHEWLRQTAFEERISMNELVNRILEGAR